ncbi:MAG: transcription-repair coupling factor [Ilumatobacteraceae bacterium]|nr:transcription-repair coupling factor [Ilumatobacteraceae bacterium]
MTVLGELASTLSFDPALNAALGAKSASIVCADHTWPLLLSGLAQRTNDEIVVVATPTGLMAGQLHDDLVAFLPERDVALFPAWETLPFERVSPNVETMGKRLEVLWRIKNDRPKIIVTGVRALLQHLSNTVVEPLVVKQKTQVDMDELIVTLARFGYRREELVEHRGEFARRGSIIDVFPSTSDTPVRIDLWGDEVDRLTAFNVNDQRSTEDLDTVQIFPARELIINSDVATRAQDLIAKEPWGQENWERIAQGATFDGMESWLPWVATDSEVLTSVCAKAAPLHIVLIEPRRMRDRARDLIAEEDDLARALASTWSRDPDQKYPRLHSEIESFLENTNAESIISLSPVADSPRATSIETSTWGQATGDTEALANRILRLVTKKFRVVIAADTKSSAQRFFEVLTLEGVTVRSLEQNPSSISSPGVSIVVAPLHNGCIINAHDLALITESDLTGRRRTHRHTKPVKRSSSSIFEDLKPGDYVVHHVHGVGRYLGMSKQSMGGVERDYMQLQYNNGNLYVPTDHIDAIRQYIGGETPTLNRMGGSDFARAKARVRSAVREIAQELVVLYQRRVSAAGHAFASDTAWQHEMEAAFPFVETPDQRIAITDTKSDMEREVPMDRLVCGDVGFGKTEVAVRAAFKCIQEGKQVAVLVPTTLLASQHGITFGTRFAGYPIRVEVLSRFLTAAQAKQVLKGLESGQVDCVIGTHRLLQEGVKFKDLGLLVVDEEQRFGVQHKEQMKQLKTNVDVLTLTATPIPRTLEMSLVGIRDLSLLNTPPADRQPILTFVGEEDDRVATEAIRRELLRDGQVFWVHNRVRSIEDRAQELRELVPEARIIVAHGQMDEAKLERAVQDFWEGKYDVLVCTTIIESGIDMPTVNTLVVERADLLGLGQLHQLRGRVGRSGQRAYAYLFHPRDRALSETAYERLRTIGEATELGSGFKIAMRDLEIRGAGNLLGEAQSGHIAAVGYDLYCQLVTEAVAEMKGEAPQIPVELKIDVPITAFLPNSYVAKEELRLDAYRRLVAVKTHADVQDIKAEWEDRFGELPDPAKSLLMVGALRAECHRIKIREIVVSDNRARLSPITLKASEAMRLVRLSPSANYREQTNELNIAIPRGEEPATYLVGFMQELIEVVALG